MDPDEITTGELGRRVDRLETAMADGFRSMRDEIRGLTFVPAGVYSSDKSSTDLRIVRLEQRAEVVEQRGWHVRMALAVSAFGALLSLTVGVVLAVVGLR